MYHVFDMYAAHQGNKSIRAIVAAPPASQSPQYPLTLSGSCSLRDKRAVLTVVNPDVENWQETEINVRNARIGGAHATVLTSRDIHARNTFEHTAAVQPVRDENLKAGSPFVYRFAPASVTRLDLDLN